MLTLNMERVCQKEFTGMENPMQVILIDHDECVRESFQMLLDSPEFSFLFFESAATGLEFIHTNDVHIVVADYFLPDMNGIEFLKTVAAEQPHSFRILMTTIINDELIGEIALSGIDMFLEKPLKVASLDTILFDLRKEYNNKLKTGDKL